MESKRCFGPFHPPGGELVPLSEYTFNITGPRAGKPLSRCKTCRSLAHTTTIPKEVFMPLLEELIQDRSLKEVSDLTTLGKQHISDLLLGKRKRITKKTFFKIKNATNRGKQHISIGPSSIKTSRGTMQKLTFEERMALRQLVSIAQKDRFKKDKQLLKHVV